MVRNSKKYSSALKRLGRYLKAHNLRPSAVRNTVLEMVCQLHQPFTAEQLIERCSIEHISVATVYNALELFVKADILRGMQRQRGHSAIEYELINDRTKHMQFVCKKCGRTVDFTDEGISRLIEERKYTNFDLQQYSLIVYGECKLCKRSAKSSSVNRKQQ